MIPINVDRNVSPSHFKDSTDKLHVTSVFYTIQGEGPFGGCPALFIRLAGCNLGSKSDCEWCDTKFSIDNALVFEVDTLANLVLERTGGQRGILIVITGGEPTLQYRALDKLIAHEKLKGYVFQLETNGAYVDRMVTEPHFVISPKASSSLRKYTDIKPSWLARENLYFKYIVEADPSSLYHKVPEDALFLSRVVFVSGMTVYKRAPLPGEVPSIWNTDLVDFEKTAANYKYAGNLALELGARLSYQTHLLAALE